jgi:hypothetical protein
MKPKIHILLRVLATTILLSGCGDPRNHSGTASAPIEADEITTACIKAAQFGDLELCLPALEGMEECMAHPLMDSLLRILLQPPQIAFAYYLNAADFAMIDSLQGQASGDYAIVYSSQEAAGLPFAQKDLELMYEALQAGMVTESWDRVKEKLKQQRDDISFGGLHLLEQYAPTPESMANVMVTPTLTATSNDIMAMIISTMRIHERMICLGYYTTLYDAEADLEKHKAKNTRLVKAILEANP